MGGRGGSSGVGRNSLPKKEAQLKHIFREANGHLQDTPRNRALLENTANELSNYLGKDKYGNIWYAKIQEYGSQVWVRTRNGIINNGGVNKIPLPWDNETGLNENLFK